MTLKCHKCESNNTNIVSSEQLSEEIDNVNFTTASNGFINKTILVQSIFPRISKILNLFTANEKSKSKIVVCKDCGYWEKI